jgi:hypothetical protein
LRNPPDLLERQPLSDEGRRFLPRKERILAANKAEDRESDARQVKY